MTWRDSCSLYQLCFFTFETSLLSPPPPDNVSALTSSKIGFLPFEHALGWFYRHGDYAVPIFWGISGAVLGFVYISPKIRVSFGNFIFSRFIRLYPLHLATLCAVAMIQLYSEREFRTQLIYSGNDFTNFILHLLFLPGFEFTAQTGFNAPVWSVSAELFTYILFGYVCVKRKSFPVTFVVLSLLASQISFAAFGRQPIFLCLNYFSIGVAGWYFNFVKTRIMLSMVLLILLVSLSTGRPSILLLVLFTSIWSIVKLDKWLKAHIKNREFLNVLKFFRSLGDLTYGIYLWHIPIQMLIIIYLKQTDAYLDDILLRNLLFVWILCTIVTSKLSLQFLEKPIARNLRMKFL